MPNQVSSPNMSLPVPVVGTDPGPQYAIDIDSCLAILDQHNHTPGSGVAITPAAININADLPYNNFNATALKTARFQPQSPIIPATGVNIDCLQVSGVDLYFNDGSGNTVRITQSGAVAGTPGSISNLVPPASASYNNISDTFVWQSDVNTPANLDAASIVLRNLVANSPGLTLSPPTLGSDYEITLPSLPATTLPVSISNAGLMSAQPLTLAQISAAFTTFITPIPPTVQIFTSTGSATYTLPTSVKGAPLYIRVRMVGGGGGGGMPFGGVGGGTGGTTSFGAASCTGGTGGTNSGGYGGTATLGSGMVGVAFNGSGGGGNTQQVDGFPGGEAGGSSPFGGAGAGAAGGASIGYDAAPNTGSGGGGPGGSSVGGTGGGSGGYIDAIITSPLSTYSIFIGAGGGAGASNDGPTAGAGAAGIIIVEEYYQ